MGRRQDRNGWAGSGPCFFLPPRFAYFRLSLSFALAPLLDLLLISSVIIGVYLIAHTHPPTSPFLSLNRFPSSSAFTIQILFLFLFLSALHTDDEAL